MPLSSKVDLEALSVEERTIADSYGTRYRGEAVPRYELPTEGMPPRSAYQAVSDELALDGNPMLNLATFVTTWMEPEADRLMAETVNKNSIDQDEYPRTVEIQNRCVNIPARLFHVPVKKSLTRDLADLLVEDVHRALERLDRSGPVVTKRPARRGKHGPC